MEHRFRKLRPNWNWIAFILTLLLLGAGFYWAVIRPERIRHDCAVKSLKTAPKNDGVYLNYYFYQEGYNFCLQGAGLPTSPIPSPIQ